MNTVTFPSPPYAPPAPRNGENWDARTLTLPCPGWIAAAAAPPPIPDAPPESWDAAMVGAWVQEAMETLKAMRTDGPALLRSGWPRDVVDALTAAAEPDERERRRSATPAAVTRMDRVLAWLYFVGDRPTRLAVVGVGLGVSLRKLGRELGCSHETARRLAERGCLQIAGGLNIQALV